MSIVVPVFNMGQFLAKALDSYLAQSEQDFEIIVCDNASTDDTQDAVRRYSDPRIRYHRNDSNIGMVNNFNTGLKLAKGKYITLISCDEFMVGSDSLKKRIELLESDSGIDLVWCDYDFETPEGNVVAFGMIRPKKKIMTASEGIQAVYNDHLSTNFRITTVIVRRQLLEVSNYVLPLFHSGDRPMILEWMIRSRNVAVVDEKIHRSFMHDAHQHDFFGKRHPFIGERAYLMLKFIDEHTPRLMAMGLNPDYLTLQTLRQLLPVWIKMPSFSFKHFNYYGFLIIARLVPLSARALLAVPFFPVFLILKLAYYGKFRIRAAAAQVPIFRKIYRALRAR